MSVPGSQDDDPTRVETATGRIPPAGGRDAPKVATAVPDQQEPPARASADGPSGTAMGTPGGVPASIAEKLPVDAEILERKPELLVAGAFVGGFLVAKVLRRIAGV